MGGEDTASRFQIGEGSVGRIAKNLLRASMRNLRRHLGEERAWGAWASNLPTPNTQKKDGANLTWNCLTARLDWVDPNSGMDACLQYQYEQIVQHHEKKLEEWPCGGFAEAMGHL